MSDLYLTLDGLPGSGKSTQLHILAAELDLTPNYIHGRFAVLDNATRAIMESHGHNTDYNALFAFMQAAHACPPPTRCVRDHFWDCLAHFVADKLDEFEGFIPTLRECLSFGHAREPNISILLKVPNHVSHTRCMQREHKQILDLTETDCPNDPNYNRFQELLVTEIPYCHIVDGTQSVENVTSDILDLVKERKCQHG